MLPLGFVDPTAKILFAIAIILFVGTEVGIRIRSSLNQGGAKREWTSLIVVVVGLGGGVAGGVLVGDHALWAAIPFWRVGLFVAGLVVIVLGVALRIWSVWVLGRFFTVEVQVHDGQSVVDTGPYRFVRHPSYTGLLLSCLGIGLTLDNWLALIIVVVLPTVALGIRIRVEERTLLAALGEPYAKFAATRSRLIPHVW